MTTPEAGLQQTKPPPRSRSAFVRLTSLPLWARLVMLTAAGMISLIGSSLFLLSALNDTADRTAKMKELFDVVEAAGEAHVAFGELRYWLTDLSVSLLVASELSAEAAQVKLDAQLEKLAGRDPEIVAGIRSEVEAYITTAMDAVDAYTDGNREIGRAHV